MSEPPAGDRGHPQMLRSLTGLRAPAALLVFASHIGYVTAQYVPALRVTDIGYVGVQLFFVLSGVVLAWGSAAGGVKTEFWWRRFTRIYPLHLVSTVFALLVVTNRLGPTLASVGLVQTWWPLWHDGGNAVSWSLCCEAFFYAMFPFLARGLSTMTPRRQWRVAAGWYLVGSLVLVAGSVLFGARFDDPLHWQPLTNAPAFVLGAVIGTRLTEGWRPSWSVRDGWIALTALTLVVLVFRALDHGTPATGIVVTIMTPAFAMILLAYALADLDGRATFLSTRLAVYAGEISFAFYLIHYTLMQFLIGPAGLNNRSWSGAGELLVISLLGTLLLSVALHEGIEKPARRYLLRIKPTNGRKE